ncbi:hypothetical protein BDV98DRAFT_593658 [Pterulicium gracile]|uniref:Protein kinase domain-containing protein n=1 Tax=Pterulicium gracile TaxID=1884261 RepID=A0A5C3QGF7_9AGAR|nr:hypothetical protein BDV98DRAFT_593658 [Pterula gracilis]
MASPTPYTACLYFQQHVIKITLEDEWITTGGLLERALQSQQFQYTIRWPEDYDGQKVVFIAKQLRTAVAFLHTHRIAHLNIKQDNIVINEAGVLTLVDYSTARFITTEEPLIESAVGTMG